MSTLCNVGLASVVAVLSGCAASTDRISGPEVSRDNVGATAQRGRTTGTDPSARAGATDDPDETGECTPDVASPEPELYGPRARYHQADGDLTAAAPTENGAQAGCDYDVPRRSYVGRSPDECSRMKFMCVEGTVMFTDACGCGCGTE